MYIYYVKVESEEHMLFTNEIAIQYGIYSLADMPHVWLISKAIKKVLEENRDLNLVGSIFYRTKTNMKQVYPYSIYRQAIDYINENSSLIEGNNYTININGVVYKYKKYDRNI